MNGHHQTNGGRSFTRRQHHAPFRLFFVGLTLIFLQVTVNFYFYLNIHHREKESTSRNDDTVSIESIKEIQHQIAILQKQHAAGQLPMPYQDDGRFYPFTIRDAKRLTPVQVSPEFHIFDYVDPMIQNQMVSKNQQLWLDGHFIAKAPCSRYSIMCYKKKILQVLDHLMNETTAEYFFYVEADNELCVPMEEIRNLTYRHERYFIGTGIGFSGWIMNRTFVQDFLEAYRPAHIHNNENPDPIGARLLMEKKAWSVTRQYLVSHTIKQGFGADPLTVGKVDQKTKEVKEVKHLPRCFEPKRTKWLETNTSTEDMHGWDFFDADDCPPGTEIYPCRQDQYVNVNFGVKAMLKPPAKANVTNKGTTHRAQATGTQEGQILSQKVIDMKKRLAMIAKNGRR